MTSGGRGKSLTQLAGWLFADVLLMLVVVVLGGQQVATPSAAARARATPSHGTSPSPSPTQTAPPGLDPDSSSVPVRDVDVSAVIAGDPAALDKVRQQVLAAVSRFAGRHAAMVFVWGTASPCSGCSGVSLGVSQDLANAVAPHVHDWDPAFFPVNSPKLIRPYFDGTGQPNSLSLELFFIRT
ncbi:hypothetical protein [Streptacidiphilus anmyonensis]|uniref:hypothetical protein n=1 Tax=Streptacidiphilus anmyonensis TaxID=405782 RepID=UPI000694BAFE|nr:hypothetical protein [Streptacidiphilus anmyonensis]